MTTVDPPEEAAPAAATEYQLADLAMAGGVPYWAVHALDDEGDKSSWILHARRRGDDILFAVDVWLPGAVQAIAGDAAGHLWAVTDSNELFTNAPVGGGAIWSAVAPPPDSHGDAVWQRCELRLDQARPDRPTCIAWADDGLLIGTFNRRLYRWDGTLATLEYDPRAPAYSGGINDIVMTAGGAWALGYGGTVLRRDDRVWGAVKAPWSDAEAEYVNLIAGAADAEGRIMAVASGGWVLAIDAQDVRATHRLPAEALGITPFHGEWYAATLDGCYRVADAGQVEPVRSGIAMGKVIDAGAMLMAVDADPDDPARAAAHLWLRNRSNDRWIRRAVG